MGVILLVTFLFAGAVNFREASAYDAGDSYLDYHEEAAFPKLPVGGEYAGSTPWPRAKCGEFCSPSTRIFCEDGLNCLIDNPRPGAGGRCAPANCDGYIGNKDCGSTCGGIAGLKCTDDFYCYITDTYPDASGKCYPKYCNGPGANCTAPCNTDKDCQFGLYCQPSPRYAANKNGVCLPICCKGNTLKGGCGDTCGGYNPMATVCKTGLVCRGEGLAVDLTGTCVPEKNCSDYCRKYINGCGGFCGGIGGIKCPFGCHCKYDGNWPDASGICFPDHCEGPKAKCGDSCGGPEKIECDYNLYCRNANLPLGYGFCLPLCCKVKNDPKQKGGCGDYCGGYSIDPVICGAGLECVYPKTDPNLADYPGICVPKKNCSDYCRKYENACGDFCGGFAGIRCPPGYFCKYDGNFPDAAGKCYPEICNGKL